MTIIDCTQKSPEWFQARLGRLTASRASDMLATIRTGEAAARRDLRTQLVLERICGVSQENGYQNADMVRGVELEPHALAAYEAKTGTFVEPVGFCLHDELLAGASPDGLIGDDGLVEVKCPRSANHLAYLRANVMPKEHVAQVVHALWITGRVWCDLVSYDCRFPEALQSFIVRYHRDDKEIATYETVVRRFLAEVDAEVEAVRTLMAPVPV